MSSLEPLTCPIQSLRLARRLIPVALVVPVLLLDAGCGSRGPTGGSSGAAGGPVAAAYAYAHCMRSHGATSFPDPHVSTGTGHTEISQEAAPVSSAQAPAFRAAEHACRGILRAVVAQSGHQGPGAAVLLAFARCLRAHGVSDFPDPDRNGRITQEMLSAAGVDLHTGVFLSAARSCIGVTHGAITAADIHQAITGPH